MTCLSVFTRLDDRFSQMRFQHPLGGPLVLLPIRLNLNGTCLA